jgi:endonuclease-3 related protein
MAGRSSVRSPLHRLHLELLDAYGPQGWWPLLGHAGVNPTKSGAIAGYHPGDYAFPRTEAERFEICAGAVLAQNTAWPNAEKALRTLQEAGALAPEALLALPDDRLAALVRPSGHYNAKARKLKALSAFHQALEGRIPSRSALLEVWGIGPETADSIRLYAYRQPEMVVDAYTRRILGGLGWVPAAASYEALKAYCVANLPKELTLYQEFHALVVEHAKRIRSAKADDWRKPVPLA